MTVQNVSLDSDTMDLPKRFCLQCEPLILGTLNQRRQPKAAAVEIPLYYWPLKLCLPVGMDTLVLLSRTNREPVPRHTGPSQQASPAEQCSCVFVKQTGTSRSHGTSKYSTPKGATFGSRIYPKSERTNLELLI